MLGLKTSRIGIVSHQQWGTWRIKLNGINHHIELSTPIGLVSGDTVEFKFIAPASDPSVTEVLVSTTGADDLKFFYNNIGRWDFEQCTATVDGSAVTDNVTAALYDGKEHVVILTITANSTLDLFGMYRGDVFHYPQPIYDLKVVHSGINLIDIAVDDTKEVQYNKAPFGPVFFPDATSDLQITPTFNLVTGDIVDVTFVATDVDTGHNDYLFDGDDATDRLYLVRNNTGGDVVDFNTTLCTMTIDGVAQVNGVTPFPEDGKAHKAKLTLTAAAKIGTLFARFNNQSSNFGEIPMLDFKVIRGGNTILHIPLTEGKDAAVGGVSTIRDIDGNIVGTLNEGAGSYWTEVLFGGRSEILNNSPNFENAVDYTLFAGASITDGICTGTDIAIGATVFEQALGDLHADRFYNVHIIIDELSTNAQFVTRLGGNTGRVITVAGDYEEVYKAGSTDNVAKAFNTDGANPLANVKISHFSIREVHPHTCEVINFFVGSPLEYS